LTRRLWIALWFRYLKLGWALRRLAADRRSSVALLYLGTTTLFRSNPRLDLGPVRVRVRLGSGAYRVALKTRTELDILEEIGLEDEYRPADAIPAETIVDLGASVGLATLRLLSSHPNAEVVAVEADPVLIPRLRENVAGLPVSVVHAAIAAGAGERQFYRSDMDSWGNSLENTSSRQSAVTVPAISLAELLDGHGMTNVDLLKLDIEGAEWEVFDGPVDPRVAAIVGEVHGREENTPASFIDRLSATMAVETISADKYQATFIAKRT
jgi:FkbM family methyltransferase